MEITKNVLASVGLEIPAMEADKEGLLKGGFSSLSLSGVSDVASVNVNCNCTCGDCSTNLNCNCDCRCGSNTNCNCTCPASTATPTPTNASKAVILGGGASLLF